MELAFKNWLIKRGNSSAANNYPRAIHIISKHYSEEIKEPIDIYKIKDQNKISELAHDYSQSGQFSKFGYEQHGRFRAAIGRYSEFCAQKNNSDEIESSALMLIQKHMKKMFKQHLLTNAIYKQHYILKSLNYFRDIKSTGTLELVENIL